MMLPFSLTVSPSDNNALDLLGSTLLLVVFWGVPWNLSEHTRAGKEPRTRRPVDLYVSSLELLEVVAPGQATTEL